MKLSTHEWYNHDMWLFVLLLVVGQWIQLAAFLRNAAQLCRERFATFDLYDMGLGLASLGCILLALICLALSALLRSQAKYDAWGINRPLINMHD